MRNLSRQLTSNSLLWALVLPQSCFFLLLHPLRHRFGTASQAEILSAVKRAEIAGVEQMKKIVPLTTCEITFGQYVCELMFGVNVPNLNFGIQINPIKQPIPSNSVGS